MRRKDREMPKEFALAVAEKAAYSTLATVNADGSPYCVPITQVAMDGALYFHCAMAGQKTDNLKRDDRVCISCVGQIRVPAGKFTLEFESAVITGKAQEVTEEAEKIQALRVLCQRFAPGNMDDFGNALKRSLDHTAVWKVIPDSITGKRKKFDAHGQEMTYGRME